MKTIIAGSRFDQDIPALVQTGMAYVRIAATRSGFRITEVVSGRARGFDRLGEKWAEENRIPWVGFPADWDLYGIRAGYIRNAQMGDYAEALIALWDGISKGTKHMIDYATKKGLRVYIERVEL